MKLRHAAALGLRRVWRYVLAAILLAILEAARLKQLDRKMLYWLSSDPQAVLRYEKYLHSVPYSYWFLWFLGTTRPREEGTRQAIPTWLHKSGSS
jgi:hypothetical protein